MRVNADFNARVVLTPGDRTWVASPMPGVERQMLDRIGGEVARATSLVRYAPGSRFAEHRHPGGEEFLVLDGVFSDESGDYPAGSYVRNPIGSGHAPHTVPGCTIFVKLFQFDAHDTATVAIDTRAEPWRPGLVSGLDVQPLHSHGTEHTALVRWAPGTVFSRHTHWGGEEIYVIQGTFEDEFGRYPAGTWIRSPHLSSHTPRSSEGCTIFVKTGHLDEAMLSGWLAEEPGPSSS
jgi:anti-sigma factor ChrR (cupin superfamily)